MIINLSQGGNGNDDRLGDQRYKSLGGEPPTTYVINSLTHSGHSFQAVVATPHSPTHGPVQVRSNQRVLPLT